MKVEVLLTRGFSDGWVRVWLTGERSPSATLLPRPAIRRELERLRLATEVAIAELDAGVETVSVEVGR